MHGSNLLKQAVLKHMLKALQEGSSSSFKNMSLLDKKNMVRLSADVAMALAEGGTSWSSALISDHYNQEKNKSLMETMFGKKTLDAVVTKRCHQTCKGMMGKRVLKKSLRRERRIKGSHHVPATHVARKMMRTRIRFLKGIVPGGKNMDVASLLGETSNYVVSLQALVDVMQYLVGDA